MSAIVTRTKALANSTMSVSKGRSSALGLGDKVLTRVVFTPRNQGTHPSFLSPAMQSGDDSGPISLMARSSGEKSTACGISWPKRVPGELRPAGYRG
jgi:hypothetical protein